MNLPQAGIALGVLTLLFGGDIYGMFAGQSFEQVRQQGCYALVEACG